MHDAIRVWDIDGQTLVNCSIEYLRTLGTLNLRGACGEQALWVKGFEDVACTHDHLTCLECIACP